MKLRTNSVRLMILVIIAVFVGPIVYANNLSSNQTCSVATLNGTYGFYRTGTTTGGPVAAVGIVEYDGAGHWTVKQHISRNGALQYATFAGEYKVASDCTTNAFFDGSQITSGVIVDDGQGFYILSHTRGITIVLVARKIHN